MMKKQIVILFGIIMSLFIISLISADSYSPSALIFNLNQDDIGCLNATIENSYPIETIYDKWAENPNLPYNVTLFEKEASYHNVVLNYVKLLPIGENQFQLCIKGHNIGEYHGVVLFRMMIQPNVAVVMGIWIKLTVKEKIISPVCQEGWIGSPFCKVKEVWQNWKYSNCSETSKKKLDCTPQNCNGGVCQVPECNCPQPSAWSTCVNSVQHRTIHDCGVATSYQCVSNTQTQSCDSCVSSCLNKECGGDGCGWSCGTCSENKVCNSENKCVEKPSIYLWIILGAFILIILFIIFWNMRKKTSSF